MKKLLIERYAFYLLSLICIGGCFWIHAFKTDQMGVFAHLEVEKGQEQEGLCHGEEIENVIRTDLNAQLIDKQNEWDEVEEKTQRLRLQSHYLELLDTKSNEVKDESPPLVYEKYFQLKQGELTRICGIEDISECWRTGFINSHFSFPAVSIGDNLYVQYTNLFEIHEYELPRNILITGSNVELGFMDARAGMNFQEIQENAYEKEIQEGFMYNEDLTVYYVEFTNGFYDYIYYSDCPDGRDTWLIICKK